MKLVFWECEAFFDLKIFEGNTLTCLQFVKPTEKLIFKECDPHLTFASFKTKVPGGIEG